MTTFDELRNNNQSTTQNTPTQSPSDRLSAMRPGTPIPGRVITHSYDSNGGRIITSSDQSSGDALQHNDK